MARCAPAHPPSLTAPRLRLRADSGGGSALPAAAPTPPESPGIGTLLSLTSVGEPMASSSGSVRPVAGPASVPARAASGISRESDCCGETGAELAGSDCGQGRRQRGKQSSRESKGG